MLAGKAWGPTACTPEPGDNRGTLWTSQDDCTGKDCSIRRSGVAQHTHNSIWLDVGVLANSTFGGDYPTLPPGTPKLVHLAVMGNDGKAGPVVWGRAAGAISSTSIDESFQFTGLKPFAVYCFRTAQDPNVSRITQWIAMQACHNVGGTWNNTAFSCTR
ncbi:MAG: hypothetical protein OXC91_13175 [Rhodobacteraceae bacterium]|nr:hypothetical protein [Paracoccaceae bacterium]